VAGRGTVFRTIHGVGTSKKIESIGFSSIFHLRLYVSSCIYEYFLNSCARKKNSWLHPKLANVRELVPVRRRLPQSRFCRGTVSQRQAQPVEAVPEPGPAPGRAIAGEGKEGKLANPDSPYFRSSDLESTRVTLTGKG
jgi:hypothetical protein